MRNKERDKVSCWRRKRCLVVYDFANILLVLVLLGSLVLYASKVFGWG